MWVLMGVIWDQVTGVLSSLQLPSCKLKIRILQFLNSFVINKRIVLQHFTIKCVQMTENMLWVNFILGMRNVNYFPMFENYCYLYHYDIQKQRKRSKFLTKGKIEPLHST